MNNLIIQLIDTVLLICTTLGGGLAFFNTRKSQTVHIQSETIQALQQQIDAIKLKVEAQERENSRLMLIIETIQIALKQRGILVTIDGDLVSLTDASGTHSIRRKRTAKTTTTPQNEGV